MQRTGSNNIATVKNRFGTSTLCIFHGRGKMFPVVVAVRQDCNFHNWTKRLVG